MCLYPRLIKNRKYLPNKKNGGQAPPVIDERTRWVPVGCQNCIECRKQKARQWQARLTEDIKHNKNGKFITLTFSNEAILKLSENIKNAEGYQLDNAIATKAVRLFLERWRKEHKKSVRHWLVTELGHEGTENIHLHGIIWTDTPEKIERIWSYGYIWQGQYVTTRTINYMTKYVTKIDADHKYYNSIILTSPGIGNGYINTINSRLNRYKPEKTQETYRTNTGTKIALPTYWRNKIYTEEQREKLWIEKLDKQERYILGQKISIKETDEIYNKLLKVAQAKNKKLGYGSDEKNWSEEQYEIERRNLKNEERRKKARENFF